ncbi:hypothetical protein ETAA8_34690 [Anatilimnocola aggregata]|uniref:Uncharacterized protein n=1 Tax=Anatilimnocola aggregata TaxID=2528021 RepID=A0A517YDT9_9BACT|nr:hypothetical protein [Anatilimnocola aggregata]QDU28369.1 hypothetical protein ETAA8_34690 [Anatilimnocola aggregata]
MLLSRTSWLASVVAGCLLFSGTTASGQQTEADETSNVVEQIALAAELTAFGRGELTDATGVKDFKSAEALVAAGGILLRIHKQSGGKMAPSDATVMDQDGKAVAEESGAAESLADEAAALFDEARALPSKDKAALEAQIKQAQTVTARAGGLGPRVVSRTIVTGHAHTVRMAVRPNAPAVVVHGTAKTHFQAIGPGGKVIWHSHGPRGIYHPGGAKDVTLKVFNHGPVTKYKVIGN